MVEKCVLCRSRWPKDKLVSACRCYKKSDSNRMHRECLANIYANKETDELPRCPDCYETYRVSVKYTFMFAWHRVCTCRSVGHLIEMIIICVMILCGAFTLLMFHRSPEYQRRHNAGAGGSGDSGAATYLVYSLFVFTLCMVPFTMKKVFERWRHANSDVEVDIV